MPRPSPISSVLAHRWQRIQSVYREFPSQFWVLVLAIFIDRLGGAMLFPFFTLYLTRRFGIGMTQVGLLFGLFSLTGVAGSVLGGALTDRLGRKGMLMFGLAASALSAALMGVVDRIELFVVVILATGLLAESGGPAGQALVADLLPEEKRSEGFGIIRVAFNLSVTIGPLIGGVLATRSYLLLFVVDAITSLITAGIVFLTLRETWRPREHGQAEESLLQTVRGYGVALRDAPFMLYLGASALSVLVYLQMNTTLAVYLRDVHGVNEQGFSYILSLNAGMVVLFQFATTRWVNRFPPLGVMTAGTLLYAIGFAMYGFGGVFWWFLLAMVIITVGEMMVSPVGQAIVARLAPESMRGRYMAVAGFSWVLPAAVGPLLAGLVLDNLDPRWLWYAAGILGVLAAAAFFQIGRLVDRAAWSAVDLRLRVIERLEAGEIDAVTAGRELQAVVPDEWVRLAPAAPASALLGAEAGGQRQVRIRVSDLASGAMKLDLHLPMALVNTVLYLEGRFHADLDPYGREHLQELVARSRAQGGPQQLEAGGDRLEVSLE